MEELAIKTVENFDELTGLWDRKTAITYISQLFEQNKKIILGLADVDFFINVESKVGRDEGDLILKRIGVFLKDSIVNGKVARYGGDEFLLILTDPQDDWHSYLELFRKKFRRQKFISSDSLYAKVPITISIGISRNNDFNNSTLLLLKSAEIALSIAKKRGRNQIAMAPENAIRVLSTDNAVCSTIIGGQLRGYEGEGNLAQDAKIMEPYGVDISPSGEILFADRGNHCIRKIDKNGIVTTVAGNGNYGYSGDHGIATLASFNKPSGIACDRNNQIYVADTGNHCIRKIDARGIITTFAGCGEDGYSGDGDLAVRAKLKRPGGVVVDRKGNVYTNDYGNNVIRMITPNGYIRTVAGSGEYGYHGDGGSPLQAAIDRPYGLNVTPDGNCIYIADYGNHCIREVDVTKNVIRTVCGTGERGYSGDGANGTKAQLDSPFWICTYTDKYILIADADNNCIRALNLQTNEINTLVGNPDAGYYDSESDITSVKLNIPAGMAVDCQNNILYIADYANNSIRRLRLENTSILK